LKTNIFRVFSILALLFIAMACSTKRNSWVSRNSHALSARDNILYNGGLALDKGVLDLKTKYADNFWQLLPIERMQVAKEKKELPPGQKQEVNPNFDRAETKATKAIQKHSMNIGGSEKNPQMDEAYLMLGKARYYDQRFVPALDAFNYVLYKSPQSNKIYEAKIWREKTNMRLDNDALAVNNLRTLLHDIKFKNQIFADANATLAQAFLNLEQKDSAIAKLKLARDFTKLKEEKARYRFILGQLYEQLGYQDSAYASFQEVIDMKRKSARQYVIYSHIHQALQFDYTKGDTIAFLKNFNKLLKDRENRPYLYALNHQMGVFYDKGKKPDVAIKYYNKSLKLGKDDQYLTGVNYKNLAEIYFYKAKYLTAGKYYDSTLVQLNNRSREYKAIKKKRDNLEEVIKYEAIASRNDSIIKIYGMSEADRKSFFDAYIDKIKKAEAAKKALRDAAIARGEEAPDDTAGKEPLPQVDENGRNLTTPKEAQRSEKPAQEPSRPKAAVSSTPSSFYFYNPSTIAFGKTEFKKNWGNRPYKKNWRVSAQKVDMNPDSDDPEAGATADITAASDVKADEITADYYLKRIPTSQKEMDSIGKERNFAYYQLGVVYKEKFKEYRLAADKLEKLLENKPEERLVLPSMYNLYKIYEIIDKDKALAMKERIIREYPDSRYASILGKIGSAGSATETPDAAYTKLFKQYQKGEYKEVLSSSAVSIEQFNGEEIVPKFELLRAHTIGKIKGLAEYKKALNYVALTYPNNEEGKQAEELLATDIPKLEALQFYALAPLSYKIVYQSNDPNDKASKNIIDKINKFFKDRSLTKLTMSYDMYTMDKNFIVIHGSKTADYAKGIAEILKEFKEYKIQEPFYIISNENYKIIQIKKNFEEYLTTPYSDPLPVAPTVLPEKKEKPADKKASAPIQKEPTAEEKQSGGFNQLPPGMPIDPAAPPQDNKPKPTQPKQNTTPDSPRKFGK
jgi:tetratricopeptide (TPR) repeat protein